MQVVADDPTFSAAVARHRSVLEQQPARHNLILGFLTRVPHLPVEDVRFWSFETPGSCALQIGEGSIVLGELTRDDEAVLAALVAALPFHVIIGLEDNTLRLVKRCEDLGMVFEDSQTLAILELDRPPRFPGSPGGARLVGAEDDTVFSAFMTAFLREAAPHDPVPSAERIASDARSGRYLFWTVDDVPVSMAGKVREQRPSAPSLAFTPRRSAAVAVTLAP